MGFMLEGLEGMELKVSKRVTAFCGSYLVRVTLNPKP